MRLSIQTGEPMVIRQRFKVFRVNTEGLSNDAALGTPDISNYRAPSDGKIASNESSRSRTRIASALGARAILNRESCWSQKRPSCLVAQRLNQQPMVQFLFGLIRSLLFFGATYPQVKG